MGRRSNQILFTPHHIHTLLNERHRVPQHPVIIENLPRHHNIKPNAQPIEKTQRNKQRYLNLARWDAEVNSVHSRQKNVQQRKRRCGHVLSISLACVIEPLIHSFKAKGEDRGLKIKVEHCQNATAKWGEGKMGCGCWVCTHTHTHTQTRTYYQRWQALITVEYSWCRQRKTSIIRYEYENVNVFLWLERER